MPGTKILWGQIIAVFALVLAGIWSATQWTAHALAYQSELGQPWFMVGNWPIYPPPAFFWWWFSFDAYAPEIFERGAMIAVSGGFAAIIVAITMSVWRARERGSAETYGTARWATSREIRKAKLFSDEGVVLGQYQDRYLRHAGPEHVLCYAPTRSGKGVGLVLPSLLTWRGSAVVHDIKGENWQKTAGFRVLHGDVLLFDPTNPNSASYNPLLEIRRGIYEVRDTQNVADILVDPEGSLDKRNHWDKTAHALLVGAILHVLYACADKCLAGVAALLSDPRRPIESTLEIMKLTPHLGQAGAHPVVAAAAQDLLNKSPNERSSIVSTAMSLLSLYHDPVVAKVTRRCSWRIADLVEGVRPATLYLVIPPSDISRTRPLMRLILNQIGRRLTEDLEAASRRHKLLLMLDEFPALGRLDFFESSLAFMAGYGIKSFLIAQSLNQIEQAYGQNNAILDNCHVRVTFATNDERTAKRVSDALGTTTQLRAMKNFAGHRLSPWLGHLMVSRSETPRALMTVDEIINLPGHEEIVMVSGVRPIRAHKARFYEDARLAARILPPPDVSAGDRPARDDDWSTLPPLPEPELPKPIQQQPKSHAKDAPPRNGDPESGANDDDKEDDQALVPELRHHIEIAPPISLPANEFDPDAEGEERRKLFARRQAIERQQAEAARRASMDRDDGIEL